LTETQARHKINKNKLFQFVISINQAFRFQDVSLNFIKDAIDFLARYNLLSRFDLHLLTKSVLSRRDAFIDRQSDVIDIISHLVPHVKKSWDVKQLLKETESVFESRVERFNDRNLVNFYYYYQSYDHPKNEKFLKALENEIITRVDSFTPNQLEESLKLFTLNNAQNKAFHSKFYSTLEANLISHLNEIDEIGIVRVVNSLSDNQDLSKAFCVEFERAISSKCPVLSNTTLLAVLNFVTLDQFKLSSDIIYEIEIEIISRRFANVNKFLIKDMTASNHYHSKNSLMNNIFKYSLATLEESNKDQNLLESRPPHGGEPSEQEVLNIFEEKKKALYEAIIKEIKQIKNPFELKLVLNVSMILKIENNSILYGLFKQLKELSQSNELSLTYLTNMLYNLSELQFYIDLNENKDLFDLFADNIRLRIHEASPATCCDLIRLLSRLILNDQSNQTLVDLLRIVSNKVITEKYFYVVQERTDLLFHLSMSPQSCDQALVEYLLSFFDPETNKFFEKEIYYLQVRRFYVLWTHIKQYLPDLKVENSKLEEIFAKGKVNMQEHNEWLDDRRAESIVLKDFKTVLDKAAKKYENVTIEASPSISCYTTDFEITQNKNGVEKVYLDLVNPKYFCINNRNVLIPAKLAKSKFLKDNGQNYQVVKYKSGNTLEEKLAEMSSHFKTWFTPSNQ